MSELARLEDLPQSYRDELTARNLVPLWPSLRGVLPAKVPTRNTRATCWPYASIRPLLLKAGELTDLTFTVDPESLGRTSTHGIFDWRDTAPVAVQRAAGNR